MVQKKNSSKDLLGWLCWVAVIALFAIILVIPSTREKFDLLTKTHPYLMGFIKVAILASLGELLAIRIVSGGWKKPIGITYRAIIWGFIGMVFVVVFALFAGGVNTTMAAGKLLPLKGTTFGSRLLGAFLTSAFMNLAFAPTFMAFHRITDTFIDLGEGSLGKIFKVKFIDVIKKIDWYGYISFVVCKTIPIFWIPAHTITFMLPEQYRVLMAAFLSIFLGAILAFAKRKPSQQPVKAATK